MLYVSFARGFKAGGFNGSDTTGIAANIPFAPEYVNAYEAGFKSEWLDDTLAVQSRCVSQRLFATYRSWSRKATPPVTGSPWCEMPRPLDSQGIEYRGTMGRQLLFPPYRPMSPIWTRITSITRTPRHRRCSSRRGSVRAKSRPARQPNTRRHGAAAVTARFNASLPERLSKFTVALEPVSSRRAITCSSSEDAASDGKAPTCGSMRGSRWRPPDRPLGFRSHRQESHQSADFDFLDHRADIHRQLFRC